MSAQTTGAAVEPGATCAEDGCPAWVPDSPDSRCGGCTELFCDEHLFFTDLAGFLCSVDYADEVAR